MENNFYLVVGKHSWNKKIFDDIISKYKGKWFYTTKIEHRKNDYNQEKDLIYYDSCEKEYTIKPRYIFFLHYSNFVPVSLINKYECVCFHMTDVPYGRGGSPLQNLIIRGHKLTKLTALKMVKQFDAGPIYLKKNLCLEGSAEEIFLRQSKIAAEMIDIIASNEIEPIEQQGKPTIFKRRTPSESAIPNDLSIDQLYDFIRMLDAEDYPKSFLNHGGFHFEFDRVNRYTNKLICNVEITKNEYEK